MLGASLSVVYHKLSPRYPYLWFDSMSSSGMNPIKANAAYFHKDAIFQRRYSIKKLRSVGSLLDAWNKRRRIEAKKRHKQMKGLTVVSEVGGQYEYTFNDVKTVRTYQLLHSESCVDGSRTAYEMNPPQYTWFNNFLAENEPKNGTRFLQILVKERQELAERVMITRLHLYSKWIKVCDHGEIYNQISDDNLKLMRERLMETIIWPSDDNPTPDP